MARAPEPRFDTGTGTELLVVVPFPSCPTVLRPQQTTEPSDFSAHVYPHPAEIAVTP
jgi:hypothetical protein